MPERLPARHRKYRRHFVERGVECTCSFAQCDDSGRKLVDGNCRNRGRFRQPSPDVGKHDDDERWQIEQQDQPGIAESVGKSNPAHQVADGRT